MRVVPVLVALALSSVAPAAAGQALPAAGTWTNNEDVAFAAEEGRVRPEWVGLEVGEDGRWRRIDAFGGPLEDWRTGAPDGMAHDGAGGWKIEDSELRKARPFVCWLAVRKFAGKPDGSEDWAFASDLPVFDQGGRIMHSGGGEGPGLMLRLRNVTWQRGSTNRPSLVLYVHTDDPERADSYGWTAPDASLVGINLRWMQASCSPQITNGEQAE